MRITVKYSIPANEREKIHNLLTELKETGFDGRRVNGGVVCHMKHIGNFKFEAPRNVTEGRLLLDVAESGGGLTKTGSSTIVCGMSGKALKPYYTPKRGHLACGEHAFFAVVGQVATVEAYQNSDWVEIRSHRIQENGGKTFHIISDLLWEGRKEELPEEFLKFQDAVEAAIDKAHCYHCRKPHFIGD